MNSILLVGNITRGVINWRLAPLPVVDDVLPWEPVEVAPDGTLQAMIDFADEETHWYEARLQELRDGMEDEEYHARGGW